MAEVKPEYRDQVIFRWNELEQLVFKVPSSIKWHEISKFADIDALIAKQGEFYESVQLKKPSLYEAFYAITQTR